MPLDPTQQADPKTALADLLNKRARRAWDGRDPLDALGVPMRGIFEGGDDLPSVPHPPLFRQNTLVAGPPELAKALEDIFKLAPELRGRVPSVTMGPTGGVMDMLDAFKIPTHKFDTTNLMGATSRGTNEIGVNPWLASGESFLPTYHQNLAHELGHVVGYPDAPEGSDEPIRQIERLADQIWPRKK